MRACSKSCRAIARCTSSSSAWQATVHERMSAAAPARRMLGDRAVFPIGLGCMNLSHAYGVPPSAQAARALLEAALAPGIDHFDPAALYGCGRNEELVREVPVPFRERLFPGRQ